MYGRLPHKWPHSHGGNADKLPHAVIDSWLAEEVFAGLLRNQAELFELEVGALDFAAVDGEFLGEGGGRGKGGAGGEGLVVDLRLNLFADLGVDGIVRQIFQFDIHSRLRACGSLLTVNAARPD